MEKERAIQCVPVEFLDRVRDLAAKLWDGKNPASVHLTAILEEYDPEVKALGNMIKEYEADYAARNRSSQSRYEQKEARLKQELEEVNARLAKSEASRTETFKRLEDLRSAFSERDAILAEVKQKTAEQEGDLNSRYVTRMQELYEKVSKKELDMLARWEDKNRDLEARSQEFESARAARDKQLKARERELEEEFNARKAELIRTFDRIREGLEAREKALAAQEAQKGRGI